MMFVALLGSMGEAGIQSILGFCSVQVGSLSLRLRSAGKTEIRRSKLREILGPTGGGWQ